MYKRYSGVEPISGVHQLVYAVDVDMNNPRYSVKFGIEEGRMATSDAFKKAGISRVGLATDKEAGS